MSIPTSYRAYKVVAQKPDLSGIELHTVDTPKPAANEVLVRITAVAMEARDCQVATGAYPAPVDLKGGVVPCADAAGVVVAVGESVKRVKVYDRVIPTFSAGWIHQRVEENFQETALGGGIDGVLQEYFLVDQEGLVKTPSYMTDVEACTLQGATLTAWNSLFETPGAHILPGQTVLVLGTGGVSISALQLAKATGARCIVTSGSDAKLERARALGATATVNYKTHPDWNVQVKEATGGEGVDHVIEIGGKGTFLRSLRSVKMGGFVGIIGYMSDYSPETKDENVDYAKEILYNGARVGSVFVGSRDMFESMNKFLSTVELHPVVDKVYKFEDAVEAFRYVNSGAHFGKVVIEL